MITRTLPGFTANASLYRTSGHYRTGKRAINLRVQQMGTMRLSAIDVPGGDRNRRRCTMVSAFLGRAHRTRHQRTAR